MGKPRVALTELFCLFLGNGAICFAKQLTANATVSIRIVDVCVC